MWQVALPTPTHSERVLTAKEVKVLKLQFVYQYYYYYYKIIYIF